MPTEIYLIKVGMNMTEGVVEEWCIPDGGQVAVGDLLYRLETEKVNLDVDAETAGTVKHLIGEGVPKEPGDVIGYIYATGETIPDDLGGATSDSTVGEESPSAGPVPTAATPVAPDPDAADTDILRASPIAKRLARERGIDLTTLTGSGPMGRIVEADVLSASAPAEANDGPTGGPSSPLARKLARELDVDLRSVRGSGPGGRITKEDVEAAAANTRAPIPAAAARPTATTSTERVRTPLRGMRKTIATRMHESLQTMAQLTMDMDVAMDDAMRLRNQLVEEWQPEGIKPTYTDLVIRAAAKALTQHPLMNASITDTEIIQHGAVNVGMAVALDEGLIVPVVRNADQLPMKAVAVESSRLAAAARDGALALDDLQDGTFTVSALGMFGVDSFTPIINSPQAGILGINRIREDLAWDGDRPVRRHVMRLSLTWDHRVLDGAPAALFLAAVKDLLESPYRLLI
ncbi:MAG: 2-oxo acid dehydrogenase subunit E2 [Pseudomonadota bacterium]